MLLKGLILLLTFEIFLHAGELFVLNTQTKGKEKEYVDQSYIRYQKSVAKVSFFERSSLVIFYICLLFTFRKIRRKIKLEQAYFSTLFILRWITTQIPTHFLKEFYLETKNSNAAFSVSHFVITEFISVLLYLLFFNLCIYLARISASLTKSFKHPKEINVAAEQSDDTENCSISCASDPFYSKSSINYSKIREQKRRLLNDYAANRPLYLCAFFILLFAYIMNPFLQMLINSLTHSYLPPNIPLQTALATLNMNTGISIPRISILRSDNRMQTMICSVFGTFRRRAVVSENLVTTLDIKDVNSLLSSSYIVLYSNDGKFQFILSILEIIIFSYVVRRTLTNHFPELSSMSRRQLTIFIPIVFISFLPVHYCFEALHKILTKRYIMKGDEYSLFIGNPITDSLVKLYVHNKDIVTHFKPYSFLVRNEPTITERLANIAVCKLKISSS